MKLAYFTDIHLCEGHDFRRGFERCLESMFSHQPQLLINGGDLGIAPSALALYDKLTREVPVPILHSNGNHEICSGYISRQSAGTAHYSTDNAGVHFAILDPVRYFKPSEAHPANWQRARRRSLSSPGSKQISPVSIPRPLSSSPATSLYRPAFPSATGSNREWSSQPTK